MSALFNSIGYESWGLHFLVWFPLFAMAAILLGREEAAKKLALVLSVIYFLASIPLWVLFSKSDGGFQFTSVTPWIPSWGIYYRIGVDGISVLLILLSTFLLPLTVLGSFNYIKQRQRAFYSMLMLLQTGVVGVFVAGDLFLFFMFWEIMLVPMYFIIGI